MPTVLDGVPSKLATAKMKMFEIKKAGGHIINACAKVLEVHPDAKNHILLRGDYEEGHQHPDGRKGVEVVIRWINGMSPEEKVRADLTREINKAIDKAADRSDPVGTVEMLVNDIRKALSE